MTDIKWIDQHGHCDGPHPEMHDGRWRYPKGRTAIRKFIKSNGTVNYELVCTISGCTFNSSPIPNTAAERLLERLPVLPTRNSPPSGHTCCYDKCGSTHVEWHHFAPRNTFGAEADNFPVQPICREHHLHWHQQMDGYQWRRSSR